MNTNFNRKRLCITGLTAPMRGDGHLFDVILGLFTFGVYTTIKYELDHEWWREKNPKADKVLREEFGSNYWRRDNEQI